MRQTTCFKIFSSSTVIIATILLPFCFYESLVHFHFIQQQWWLTWVDHQIWGLRMGTKHLMSLVGAQLLKVRIIVCDRRKGWNCLSGHNNSLTLNCSINSHFSNTYWGAETQYQENQTLALTFKYIDQEAQLSTTKGYKGKTEDALSEQSRRWNSDGGWKSLYEEATFKLES